MARRNINFYLAGKQEANMVSWWRKEGKEEDVKQCTVTMEEEDGWREAEEFNQPESPLMLIEENILK